MTDAVAVVQAHRNLILCCEMGAMLHDMGKLGAGWVLNTGLDPRDPPLPPRSPNLHPAEVLNADAGLITEHFRKPLADLLEVPEGSDYADEFRAVRVADFVEKHEESAAGEVQLLRLLARADKRDSGEEQSGAEDRPQRAGVYGATVFGLEEPPIDCAALDRAREQVWAAAARFIAVLTRSGASLQELDRERAEFLKACRKHTGLTVAKTQRAGNDVTLYQHGRAVATRFKAFLARDLARSSARGGLHFRLLSVVWDPWLFTVHVPRLSDAVGRRERIRELRDKIRFLVEVELPVGNVVYEDDGCLVALVADLEMGQELAERVSRFAAELTQGEITPSTRLSDPTERITDVVAELRAARTTDYAAGPPAWATLWQGRRGAAICPVCGLRPLRRHADPACDWCRDVRALGAERRAGRRQETVWTGEIADCHGRMALLVARLGVDRWLTGDMLFTAQATGVRARAEARGWGQYPTVGLAEALRASFQDPDTLTVPVLPDGSMATSLRQEWDRLRKDLANVRAIPGIPEDRRAARIASCEQRVAQFEREKGPELARLQGALLVSEVFSRHQGEMHQYLLGEARRLPQERPLAERYAAMMARKNPSAGRLLRIWEGAERFLCRALESALERITSERPATDNCRVCLALGPEAKCLPQGIYTVALVRANGERRKTEVFLRGAGEGEKQAITIRRLTRDERDWMAGCAGTGRVEVLAGESGGRVPDCPVIGIRSAQVEEYRPYHVVSASPNLLVVALPADIAPQVATQMHRRYWHELGKVAGRLPLYLCLLFMDEHFPMFVALDAVRRAAEMAETLAKEPQRWRVIRTPTATDGPAGLSYELELKPPGRSPVLWRVPAALGNGEPDYYHPNFIVASAGGTPLASRSTYLDTPVGEVVHVSELGAGDEVLIYPNRFDFRFLDSPARRFDLRLEDGVGPQSSSPLGQQAAGRPYLLDDLERLERTWRWCRIPGMTSSRLYAIRDLLLDRAVSWGLSGEPAGGPRWQAYEWLVEQVLNKEFGIYAADRAERIALRQAMLDGTFFDSLELHLEILKEKG